MAFAARLGFHLRSGEAYLLYRKHFREEKEHVVNRMDHFQGLDKNGMVRPSSMWQGMVSHSS